MHLRRAIGIAVMLTVVTAVVLPAYAQDNGRGWWPFGRKSSSWPAEDPFKRSVNNLQPIGPAIQLAPGYPTLSTANLQPIRDAIQRYQAIVAQGGWPEMPAYELRPGRRHAAVPLLRERLIIAGDLTQNGGRQRSYDSNVEAAVKRFQERHGLKPSGIVDVATLQAFNVAPSVRVRQLQANLAQLEKLAKAAANKYVVVNIPAAQVEAVENGRVVSRHVAVVGKLDRQTPTLKSKVHEINFNPYWTVPRSIVRKDLVPKARDYQRQGLDVLESYRMDAYDARGRRLNPKEIDWNSDAVYKYTYKQVPWEDNSLGFVKINFHNKHAVYMHDTPLKNLFGSDFRAESSGCVRVADVDQLVAWMLRDTPGWDLGRVQQMKQTGQQLDVKLKSRIPVYFVYLTAWATPDGQAHFRHDMYRRHGVGVTASAY